MTVVKMGGQRDTDAGWSWVILGACAISSFTVSGMAVLAGIFQKVFLEEFDGGLVLTSWITSIFASLMQLCGIISGLVCRVFGCRVAIMSGGVLMTLGLLVSSRITDMDKLVVPFSIFCGVGMGLVFSANIVAVNLSFVKYRPLATGIVFAAGGVGIIAFPPFCQYLLDTFRWRISLIILAAISAQVIVAGATIFPPTARARACSGHVWKTFHRLRKNKPKQRDAIACYTESNITNGVIPNTVTPDEVKIDDECTVEKLKNTTQDGEVCVSSAQCIEECTKLLDGLQGDCQQTMEQARDTLREGDSLHDNHDKDKKMCNGDTVAGPCSQPEHRQTPQHDCSHDNGVGRYHDNDLENPDSSPDCNSVHRTLINDDISDDESEEHRISASLSHIAQSLSHIPSSTSPCLKYWSAITNPSVALICMDMCFYGAAIGIVFIHFVNFCLERGTDAVSVSVAFSAHGLGLAIGRILVGIMGQDRTIDPLAVFVGLSCVCTLNMLITPLVAVTPIAQIIDMGFLGAYSAAGYSVLPEITIHCASLDILSEAYGLETAFAGIGYLVAPPLAAWLVDVTETYSNAIYLSALLRFFGVLCMASVSLTRPEWTPKPLATEVEIPVDEETSQSLIPSQGSKVSD